MEIDFSESKWKSVSESIWKLFRESCVMLVESISESKWKSTSELIWKSFRESVSVASARSSDFCRRWRSIPLYLVCLLRLWDFGCISVLSVSSQTLDVSLYLVCLLRLWMYLCT